MTAVNGARASRATSADPHMFQPSGDGERRALNVRFGAGDGRDVALGHVHRPTWRGRIHSIGLAVAVPAVVLLLLVSSGDALVRLGVAVYAVGVCSMLAASAIYHRWVHGLRARCAWRRVDHAAIFAAIAGSSTPIVLVALPGGAGLLLVGAIWSAAFVGAGCKLSKWSGGDRAGSGMYAVTIGLGALALPWLWAREGTGPAGFVAGGGVVYLVGAACFAKQWPTMRPTVFSYHEVWHAFTMVAAMAQFVAIWMLAT
jgi:hemolysin III